MSEKSNIEWTDTTWNPFAGCSKISAGCKNCYAIRDAVRLSGNTNPKISKKYAGTVSWYNENGKANWTGKINLASDETLLKPIRWTKPRRIFVNSMSDLFHEAVPFEWIDTVFAIMSLAPHHTFQILTKRAARMKGYFDSFAHPSALLRGMVCAEWLQKVLNKEAVDKVIKANFSKGLPNVHLGVSVEGQAAANERIPLLLQTPAGVRWLSCEPLLETIEFSDVSKRSDAISQLGKKALSGIDWVVVGGESGDNARVCNVDWIRSIVQQCQSANVPVFVKQLGAKPFVNNTDEYFESMIRHYGSDKTDLCLKDKKGGDLTEMPIDLQVREFPKGV